MEEKYNYPEDDDNTQEVNDPAVEYQRTIEMKFSPPLTEEEMKESMSTEEFKEHWFKCIDEIYKK